MRNNMKKLILISGLILSNGLWAEIALGLKLSCKTDQFELCTATGCEHTKQESYKSLDIDLHYKNVLVGSERADFREDGNLIRFKTNNSAFETYFILDRITGSLRESEITNKNRNTFTVKIYKCTKVDPLF